ncbi:Lysozyme OS=Streptomyces antimycoticus OX=68175 GN=SANT12839_087540 PE=3 SV=1 [Streptomyces antimycoticus]
MSLKSGKGAHRDPSRLRSPHAIGALGVAVTAAVLATLVPATAGTADPRPRRRYRPGPRIRPAPGAGTGWAENRHETSGPGPRATRAGSVEGVDVSDPSGFGRWAALWDDNVRSPM